MDLSLYPRRTPEETLPTSGPVVVGTVAHLSPEKGLKYLIEAASLIPDIAEKDAFCHRGRRGMPPGASGTGRTPRDWEMYSILPAFIRNTSQFMKSFDIFALPSLSEGLSSAILEAMANSLPIIATHVGGIPELVRNGDNGLLVAPGDPAALALCNPTACRQPGGIQAHGGARERPDGGAVHPRTENFRNRAALQPSFAAISTFIAVHLCLTPNLSRNTSQLRCEANPSGWVFWR